MQALATVPEPLWWLLGAVVAFYFGAREAHHARLRQVTPPQMRTRHAKRPAKMLKTRPWRTGAPIKTPDAGNPLPRPWVQTKFLQPVFQVFGQMRHSHQVIGRRGGRFRFGGGDGFGVILGLEGAAPDPGHGGQAGCSSAFNASMKACTSADAGLPLRGKVDDMHNLARADCEHGMSSIRHGAMVAHTTRCAIFRSLRRCRAFSTRLPSPAPDSDAIQA